MALFQFACPYCSGQFEIENPPAAQPVECPHCGGKVALPAELPPTAELPPPIVAPLLVENVAPASVAPATDAYEQILPFDLDDVTALVPRRRRGRTERAPLKVHKLSREEKERRRLARNIVLMTLGIVVLSVAAVLLSRI